MLHGRFGILARGSLAVAGASVVWVVVVGVSVVVGVKGFTGKTNPAFPTNFPTGLKVRALSSL